MPFSQQMSTFELTSGHLVAHQDYISLKSKAEMNLDEKLVHTAAWLKAFAVHFQFQKLKIKIVSGLFNFFNTKPQKFSKHFKSGLVFSVCVKIFEIYLHFNVMKKNSRNIILNLKISNSFTSQFTKPETHIFKKQCGAVNINKDHNFLH